MTTTRDRIRGRALAIALLLAIAPPNAGANDVDTLPLSIQPKLLRALQEGEIQRIGSPHTGHFDVRIVAATNKDLFAEMEAGCFREDLFYRLNVVPIRVPPLRERREDIAPVLRHFIGVEGAWLLAPGVHNCPGSADPPRGAKPRSVDPCVPADQTMTALVPPVP